MTGPVAAVIVSSDRLRAGLENVLCDPAFRIVACKESLSDLGWEGLSQSEPRLVVIECDENPRSLAAQIAKFKQQDPQAKHCGAGARLETRRY
jgi:hypothetical protein